MLLRSFSPRIQLPKIYISDRRVRCQSIASSAAEPTAVGPRWLSESKARVGTCLTFGCPPALYPEAGNILEVLARDWRDFTVGTEGYLTGPDRAGLYRQHVVWGEQDSFQHVNNVQYVRYAESGRCNWARNIGRYFDRPNQRLWQEILTPRNVGLILKSITVDFKFPMTWPDRISVYHKIRDRPTETTESLILDVVILSEAKQRPAARCLEDILVYDYIATKKNTLPPFMLEQFVRIFELQEEAKAQNSAKVQEVSQRIRHLEQQTWDRSDAQEVFG